MIKEYEKEYEELLKLGENAGILELMKFYGGYDEYLRESQDFFKLTHPEMEFSATNFTYMINEE